MTFSKLGTDRDTGQFVYLPKAARLQGLYIIGIQGTGKSGLIENLIMQDIDQQIGVCVLDPHGELIDHVIARLDTTDVDRVIFLELANYQYPFGLNLFTCADLSNPLEVQKTVDQILHIFEKLLGVSQDTPLILEYLYNCTYTLVANPGYTMADIPMLLQNEQCRRQLVAQVTDPDVRFFWQQHDLKKPSDQNNDIASTLRRVKQFLQPLSRPIVGQSKTTLDLQQIMNQGKILLVKLSTQVDSVSSLIGSLMVALLLNAAYNRPAQRRQFHLYADEFQRFATEDFATLLEEARKFGIATTIAHQNRGQLNSANSKLETDLKDRSRSVGNMVVFKINSKDADDLAGEFDTTPPQPKQEEATRRAIQTPVSNPIHWLLSGKTHTNPTVNTFISKWNIKTIEQVKQDKEKLQWAPYMEGYATQFLDELNRLAYQTMLYKNPDNLFITPEFLQFIFIFLDDYFSFNTYYEKGLYYQTFLAIVPENVRQQMTLFSLINLLNTHQWASLIDRECHKKMILRRLDTVVAGAVKDSKGIPFLTTLIDYFHAYEPHIETAWLVNLNVNSLQWRAVQEDNSTYMSGVGSVHLKETRIRLVKGQETSWYTLYSLEREIDRLMASPKMISPRVSIVEFLSDLLAMVRILAVEPIEEDSGRQETVYRPGPVRPFQDIKNDIANQLSGLPSFAARVKISGNAPQNPGHTCLSCGYQSRPSAMYCGICGIKLSSPNEYTITTLKPAGGIGTQQLRQRIARIQARNLQDGYVRERVTVEAEILQRQQSFQPVPALPHVPQPQRVQHHVRQVPVQGNCPTCGKSNPPGSKFCNQCGAKL